MSEVVLYIACSLDGCIAAPDGGVSWLSRFEGAGEDYGYAAFYAGIGTVILGAATYRQVLGFGEWPYAGVEVIVFSRREVPQPAGGAVQVEARDPAAVVAEVRARSARDIWLVGGAGLVESFLRARLVDRLILSVVPVLLGAGIPLFRSGIPPADLELIGAQTYPGGLVQITYRMG